MTVRAIPEDYGSITPYLYIMGAAEAIEFYKRAFGTSEILRIPGVGGRIGHAELRIGGSIIMLADEHPSVGVLSPKTLGGTSFGILLYVNDVDQVVARTVAAGAKLERPIQNQFYGDRSGTLLDPFGHKWTIATHIEDVTPEEMDARMKKMVKSS